MSRKSSGILITIIGCNPDAILTFDWFGLIQKLFRFFFPMSDHRLG
jgi:hypothetical protein